MSGTVLGFYNTSVDNRQNSWNLTHRTVPLLLPFFTQTVCVCVCVCVVCCTLGALWFYCLYWNDLSETVCVCVCVCVWYVVRWGHCGFTAYTEMTSLSQCVCVCVCVCVVCGMSGALWFYCLYWNDVSEPVLKRRDWLHASVWWTWTVYVLLYGLGWSLYSLIKVSKDPT